MDLLLAASTGWPCSSCVVSIPPAGSVKAIFYSSQRLFQFSSSSAATLHRAFAQPSCSSCLRSARSQTDASSAARTGVLPEPAAPGRSVGQTPFSVFDAGGNHRLTYSFSSRRPGFLSAGLASWFAARPAWRPGCGWAPRRLTSPGEPSVGQSEAAAASPADGAGRQMGRTAAAARGTRGSEVSYGRREGHRRPAGGAERLLRVRDGLVVRLSGS